MDSFLEKLLITVILVMLAFIAGNALVPVSFKNISGEVRIAPPESRAEVQRKHITFSITDEDGDVETLQAELLPNGTLVIYDAGPFDIDVEIDPGETQNLGGGGKITNNGDGHFTVSISNDYGSGSFEIDLNSFSENTNDPIVVRIEEGPNGDVNYVSVSGPSAAAPGAYNVTIYNNGTVYQITAATDANGKIIICVRKGSGEPLCASPGGSNAGAVCAALKEALGKVSKSDLVARERVQKDLKLLGCDDGHDKKPATPPPVID